MFTLDCRDGGWSEGRDKYYKKADFLSSKDLKLLPVLREANDCGRMEEE